MIYMDDDCLICEKNRNYLHINISKCKMCGMSILTERKFNGFIFCSVRCENFFQNILNLSDEKYKEDTINRDIVI